MSKLNAAQMKAWIVLGLISFSGGPKLWAQAKKQQAAPVTPPVRTVGDMLRQAGRGSDMKKMEKASIVIPGSPVAPLPTTRTAPPVDLSSIKPPNTKAFYQGGDDKAKLEAITDRQIKELYKLTQNFKNSPNRGELWLRLAELYSEKAGIMEFRKQDEFDRKLQAFQSGQSKIRPSKPDTRDAREYNLKAIQLYEWFVRDFPKDAKADQALFFLGYNHFEMGNAKKGTEYYTRLTKEHPNSIYNLESSFALAEYWFENEKWTTAQDYYLKIVPNRRHRLHAPSVYKLAWCYFRSGDSKKALSTMEYLVKASREEGQNNDALGKRLNKGKLESEGLRDIILFYSEAGDPKSAPGYFQSLVPNQAAEYTEKLAYVYVDKGNRDGARYLLNNLIARNPISAKAFEYKYQIVQSFTVANRSKEFREELYSWVKDFGTQSPWFAANQSNKELIENSTKLREQVLRTWVLQQHQTAQNSRTQYAQALAFEGYRTYLLEFNSAASAGDMHFYFGELLYDMSRFEDAGVQYKWVVEHSPQSKFFAKSGENMVLSMEKGVPKDEEITEKVGKNSEPVQLEPKIEKFVAAGNWYANKFPNSEKTPEIKFRVARILYQHNQFDKAIPVFKDIVQKHSKTKYSEFSANLLLDIYNIKKDYVGLEKTGTELLAVPSIAGSAVGAEIRNVLQRANFSKAKALEDGKEYGKSAEQFEVFAKQHPGSEYAAAALFNAAINYEKAGQNSKAINTHMAVIKSNDKGSDKFKSKSRRILAKLYQDAGLLEEAAAAYEQTAMEAGSDSLAPNLFFNAAILNEALGRPKGAIRNYESYFAKVKKASDRAEAVYSMATIHREASHISLAINSYKEFLNLGGSTADKNVESTYWIFELSRLTKRNSEAEEWRKRTLGVQAKYAPDKKGVGAKYAAKIKLIDAAQTYTEFRSITLNNLKKAKELSDRKLDFLKKLTGQLTEIVKYDSPDEIVSSLYILGQAQLNMGESFVNAPLPPELKAPEEISQYKAGIQKLADPFFDKAKQSLKAAVEKGNDFEAYTPEYKKARETLIKWDPNVLHDGGEVTTDFRTSGWAGL